MAKLSKNFTLEECTASSTAAKLGINNTPDKTILAHLTTTVTVMLQPIRDLYGKGIKISSGYRSYRLNVAIGGAATSQHVTGYALDIKPTDTNDMSALMSVVLSWAKKNKFDQIILEQCTNGIPSWIHIGYRHITKGQRCQILVAKKVNGKWNYTYYKE